MRKYLTVLIIWILTAGLSACSSESKDEGSEYVWDTTQFVDTDTWDNENYDPGMPADSDSVAANADTEVTLDVTVKSVAMWRDDRNAAYSIIHDDVCDWSTMGIETNWVELQKRNLVGGFGVIVSACNEREDEGDELYKLLKKMTAWGNEIINHSYTHPSGSDGKGILSDGVDVEYEIITSNSDLEKAIGSTVEYFVFPLDSYDDAILTYLKEHDFLGARGGIRGVGEDVLDATDELAPFRANFDCFNENRNKEKEDNCSKYDEDTLKQYLDDVIAQKVSGIREFHNIGDSGWGNVTLPQYSEHLDYVAKKVEENKLWVDTPLNVMKYRAARAYCGKASADNGVVSFEKSDDEMCIKYSIPLTVKFDYSGKDVPSCVQGNRFVDVKKTGDLNYMGDINPAGGPAYIIPSK
ncbi:MAG: polysaccharide deacetylase family protein [Deltaproteobacteria bacterium]|nr:polysaccharide deacetylase family protein [Deltaproteobacteria bacterium]